MLRASVVIIRGRGVVRGMRLTVQPHQLSRLPDRHARGALSLDKMIGVKVDEARAVADENFWEGGGLGFVGVEEPVEIMDREVKRLKRSKISLVKVSGNSKRDPEFTWECGDYMKFSKYPQLFIEQAGMVKPLVLSLMCLVATLMDRVLCDSGGGELHENTEDREILFLYCYAFSVSILLTPLCCDDIHDVTPRVSALAGCDRLVSEPMVIEN
ncbi:hypothetical protein Tco_0923035 [Tanacetum coccineum]|uniref:Uncharacterized protein n=1 Tax=Tanacetum coccineum TaxID=301880 RepID=A0ABQ5CZU9_9ASTR